MATADHLAADHDSLEFAGALLETIRQPIGK